MMDMDDAQSWADECVEEFKKEIREILDRHEPFNNWKAVSRALDEIIDLVGWIYPDERNQSYTEKAKETK